MRGLRRPFAQPRRSAETIRQQMHRIGSMFESDFDRDNHPLVGISVSAVLLLALACVAGCLAMLFGMTCVGSLLGGDKITGRLLGFGLITIAGCAFCIVTFFAWKALYRERRWALWVARIWAALVPLLSGLDLYQMHQPHTPAPDEYFGNLCDPAFIIGGTMWLLYLWLPKVRAQFRIRHLEQQGKASVP